MIAMCLVKDPAKRPTAEKLLRHSFFKQARSYDYISRHILEGLPPLGERVKTLKVLSLCLTTSDTLLGTILILRVALLLEIFSSGLSLL